MAEPAATRLTVIPEKYVVATGVSADEYLVTYAGDHHEWVQGVVIRMTPITLKHEELVTYLKQLFSAYFALKPIGRVLGEPFVMRLDATGTIREPDLQIILNENLDNLTDTAMIGPADVCIEVVSPESTARDYGAKFEEYEKAGVREYWIIDPQRKECRFHRLNEHWLYTTHYPDADADYTTPLLPRLRLHIPTLWADKLPDFYAIGAAVQAMVAPNT